MNKKAKKTLIVLIIILLSVFPIIMRLYASDYSGIISKLKTDSKINEIGAEILRVYTMVWSCILVSSHIYSRYSCSNINNCR